MYYIITNDSDEIIGKRTGASPSGNPNEHEVTEAVYSTLGSLVHPGSRELRLSWDGSAVVELPDPRPVLGFEYGAPLAPVTFVELEQGDTPASALEFQLYRADGVTPWAITGQRRAPITINGEVRRLKFRVTAAAGGRGSMVIPTNRAREILITDNPGFRCKDGPVTIDVLGTDLES
jgi:hypothetical protein